MERYERVATIWRAWSPTVEDMDNVSKEKRSDIMSHIRGKNTIPEMKLRRYLFAQGYRYRLHYKTLPGHPDIVLPKYRTTIFVNGCFWHHHPGCAYATTPKSRTDFWDLKFERNCARDARMKEDLETMGWRVIIVWECELRGKNPEALGRIEKEIRGVGNEMP